MVTFPASLAGVDLGRLVVMLEATLRRHGARTQAHSTDTLLNVGRGGLRAIASIALDSDRIERAVVSEIRVAPFFAGVAMVVIPRADLDAPLLVADLMIPPPGSTRAYIDTCGPAIARRSFAARFREPLTAILDGATGVSKTIVPAFIAPLSGGAGARLRARPRRGEVVARLVRDYLDRYLHALASAERAADSAANVAAASSVREAFRAHGPAARHLTRAFGAPFASSYLDLLWGA